MLDSVAIKKSDDFRKHLQFVDSGLASLTSDVVGFASLLHADLQGSNFLIKSFFKILRE